MTQNTPQPLDLFGSLGLSRELLRGVEKAGYEQPTPIQQAAIKPALEGRDLIACAQTGTGKTAAFSLPLLQRVSELADDEYAIRALVLTPTRELAAQIGHCLEQYAHDLDLSHAVIFGGVSEKHQIKVLREGIDVLVATPGRLLDLIGQGEIDLRDVGVLVLDEADRMLDMGFLPDVKRVLKHLPQKKQTLLFSATMPDAIRSLADDLMRNPEYIAVTPSAKTADDVVQQLHFVPKQAKRSLLLKVLDEEGVQSALVFSRTKHGANKIAKYLEQNGVRSAAIHGNKSQSARTKALSGFRRGFLRVLVATDIASRGIDVDGISHVINFDLPNEPETYVHRIGRTGRAGASGIAVSFCDQEEVAYLRDIERLTKKPLERIATHEGFDAAPAPKDDKPTAREEGRRRRGNRSGRRRSNGARSSASGTTRGTRSHSARV